MPSAPLINLPDGERVRAAQEIVRFRHRLADTGLFTDEALTRLIDETPREHLTICTMPLNPPPDRRWIAGHAGSLDGAGLMEAVRRGRLWVSPCGAMTRHPTYRAVFDRLMGEFRKATGLTVLRAEASVLVSSPRMGIFLHVDPAETMLLHVRGHKTMRVYPSDEAHLSENALEAILLGESLTDVPYDPAMEAAAQVVPLAPGEAAFWPQHRPHRVVNDGDLNVSVSVEFTTPRSAMANSVFYLNGRLRRRFGHQPRSRSAAPALKPAYLAASRLVKVLAPVTANAPGEHVRQFDVDLAMPHCLRWRPGFPPLEDRASAA